MPDELERALHRFLGLEGVYLGQAGQGGHLVVDLRVVLHGTAAERVEVVVDGEVVVAELREVADDLAFGDLRHVEVVTEHGGVGQFRLRHVQLRMARAYASRRAAVHEELAVVLFQPALWDGHTLSAPISARAEARCLDLLASVHVGAAEEHPVFDAVAHVEAADYLVVEESAVDLGRRQGTLNDELTEERALQWQGVAGYVLDE